MGRLPRFFFPESWRQEKENASFDQSKRADIAEDVLCWVEGVGVNMKNELMQQNEM